MNKKATNPTPPAIINLRRWLISYVDFEGEAKTKEVQAMDVWVAISISALIYSQIIGVKEIR